LVGKFERDIKNKKNVSSNFSSSERINDYLDNL